MANHLGGARTLARVVDSPPGKDHVVVVLRDYLHAHRARIGRVGNAPRQLVDFVDLLNFRLAWMRSHLGQR